MCFIFFVYAGNKANDNPHKTSKDTASMIVVINGLAITAGSSLHFFASKGNIEPTIFEIVITINIARQIIAATR